MDADAFVDAVEADRETELSRLGSSKALYAATAGEMATPAVLAALAARARAAAESFDGWAADAERDEAVAAFGAAADVQRLAADRLDAPDDVDVPAPGPLFDHLRGLESAVDRAAGLVAWTLVSDATRAQAVGFFVGSADEATAGDLRELRDDLGPAREQGLALLASTCEDDADWDRALEAAGATVDAAYAGYVEVLEDLGVAVKPIC